MTGHLLSRVRKTQAGLPSLLWKRASECMGELEKNYKGLIPRSVPPSQQQASFMLHVTSVKLTPLFALPALGSGYLVFFSFVWPKQKMQTEGLC